MLKKFLIPIASLFLILAVLIAIFLPAYIEKSMITTSINDAKRTVSQFKLLRGYYTKNVIAKAKKAGMKPHFDHASDPDSIPLPATMIHELSDLISKTGTELKLYSAYPFPNRKSRQLDNFQQKAWDTLSRSPDDVFVEETQYKGQDVLRIAIADTMQAQACVDCHNTHPLTPKNDWKLGQVRGVLEVIKPLTEIQSLSAETRWQIIGFIFIIILAMGALLWLLFEKIVIRQTKILKSKFAELAEGEGDLSLRLEEKSDDEMGDVAKSFNRFLESFHNLIVKVTDTATHVDSSSVGVQSSTEQIVSKLREQEEQSQMIATAITQLSASINEISENTEKAAENSKISNKKLHDSSNNMQQSIKIVQNLNESIGRTGQVVTDLREKSDDIGKVLDVIKAIAEQTNLLALNAAIEAARAGEQGRGFAVVADEVRALAHRTQESIQEIQSTVESLQSKAEEAEQSVVTGCEQADKAQENINQVNNELMESMRIELDVSGSIESIATAMEQQSAVANEMDKNVIQLKDSSMQSLAEINRIVELLHNMSEQTEHLTDMLTKFKL